MISTVHTSGAVLALAVFLACSVEMVEALTIVVAVGVSRGWRAALVGAAAAVGVLAVLVAGFGPALLAVPLSVLRLVVGALLLVLGLQWLRKAILRAAGLKAKHDEDAIFAEQVAQLSPSTPSPSTSSPSTPSPSTSSPSTSSPSTPYVGREPGDGGSGPDGRSPMTPPPGEKRRRLHRGSHRRGARQPTTPVDRTGAVVAFKGVFLEGLEVVVLVLTLGSAAHDVPLAAVAAAAAIIVVGAIGAVLARQLSGVPENAMKMAVGLMLVSFGTFWSGEGVHVRWPGSDLAVVALVALYGVGAWLLVHLVSVRRSVGQSDRPAGAPVPRKAPAFGDLAAQEPERRG